MSFWGTMWDCQTACATLGLGCSMYEHQASCSCVCRRRMIQQPHSKVNPNAPTNFRGTTGKSPLTSFVTMRSLVVPSLRLKMYSRRYCSWGLKSLAASTEGSKSRSNCSNQQQKSGVVWARHHRTYFILCGASRNKEVCLSNPTMANACRSSLWRRARTIS